MSLSYDNTGWGPQDSVQLPYKWLNHGFMVHITTVNGVYKATNITGGAEPCFEHSIQHRSHLHRGGLPNIKNILNTSQKPWFSRGPRGPARRCNFMMELQWNLIYSWQPSHKSSRMATGTGGPSSNGHIWQPSPVVIPWISMVLPWFLFGIS